MARVNATNHTIPNFNLIAPSIWVYDPPCVYAPTYFPPKDVEAPSLILLCTWTGAQNRYIAKYTAEYRYRFPSTRIMVVTTSAKDLCFRSSKRKQQRMKPAIECILNDKHLNNVDINGGILMHIFSEGGSNKACELAEAYYNTTATRLPVSALCFDSTPGHPRYIRICNALNKSLPPIPVLRHIGLSFAVVVAGSIWILYCIKGSDNNIIAKTRRRLHDPTRFDLTVPRCYLYSKGDALIAWQDVYEHAEETRQLGVPVREVLFEGSAHCGHARHEPDRYWDAVAETWRSSIVSEKRVPKLDLVIEEVELTFTRPEMVKMNDRWSCADSQRTLLPDTDICAYRLV